MTLYYQVKNCHLKKDDSFSPDNFLSLFLVSKKNKKILKNMKPFLNLVGTIYRKTKIHTDTKGGF